MFKGSYVAIVTPFHPDGRVDYEKFVELIKFHRDNQSNGIVVSGTTGEGTTLSDEEKNQLLRLAIFHKGTMKIIANASSNDTAHSLKLAKEAQALHADGLLLINPYYNKCNHQGMYLHFAEVAKNVDLPIILYNVPSRTGVTIPIDIIKNLSQDFPNVQYIKDAGSDIEYSKNAAKYVKVFSGDDNNTLNIIDIGGVGVISVVANIIPFQFSKMCALKFEKKDQEAQAILEHYKNFIDHLFIEVNPIPIKAAMEIDQLIEANYRLPLCRMSEENYQKMKKAKQI